MEALGALYFFGTAVEQDYAQAAKWYLEPAQQGSTYAQYLLGYMYEDGKGVDKDPAQAAKWYKLAADKGDARAQSRLGWMYYEGTGVEQDLVEAYMWSNLAAAQLSGDERAQVEKVRDFIASKLKPEELAQAQQRARDWQPKAQ
jgi:TPR repeat protein